MLTEDLSTKNIVVIEHLDEEISPSRLWAPAPKKTRLLLSRVTKAIRSLARRPRSLELEAGNQRFELDELLKVFNELGLDKTILETRLGNGQNHLLWLSRFQSVISICTTVREAIVFRPQVDRQRSLIIVGIPWEISTIKKVPKLVKSIDALVIDENRYERLMPSYVMYGKLVRPGGLIAVLNASNDGGPYQHVKRFIRDLESGYVDGYQHKIREIHEGGTGVSYEIRGYNLSPSNPFR